ncbi:MAG: divalent cation tolerance protein CutA [Patescibacteria group bacterium]|nr:divalent cation tolerance protein CutA [Patescibacteria group bacterium]
MTDAVAIFVNIPCPTIEEAKKLCGSLLKKGLCGTVQIKENTHLMYTESGKVEGDDIVMMSIKTTKGNLKAIEAYILANHSWGTPCVDVVPIITDHC